MMVAQSYHQGMEEHTQAAHTPVSIGIVEEYTPTLSNVWHTM